jgi:thiopeptide-type bacteriocin biosynthesis protein
MLKQKFLPGQEWVYLKIYCNPRIVEKLLISEIPDIINHNQFKEMVDRWFFLRFSNPDFHLRIRFHLRDQKFLQPLLDLVFEKIAPKYNENVIWKIELDEYDREIDRYGKETMCFSEKLFHFDSELMLNLLKLLDNFENEDFRFISSVFLINVLFDDFNYSLNDRYDLVEKIKKAYESEFKPRTDQRKKLAKKYRQYKELLESTLSKKQQGEFYDSLYMMVKERSSINSKVISEVNSKLGSKSAVLHRIISSIFHMSINRLFKSQQRQYEFVVFDFLQQHYLTQIKCIEKEGIK